MGKIVDSLRKQAQEYVKQYPDARIDEDSWVLSGLDDKWREEIDDAGLGLGWTATPGAIPIIEECLEKGDGTAYNQWVQSQLDNMQDGEVW